MSLKHTPRPVRDNNGRRPAASGLPVRSGLRAGSVVGTVVDSTRAVVATIPPKLLSFEA